MPVSTPTATRDGARACSSVPKFRNKCHRVPLDAMTMSVLKTAALDRSVTISGAVLMGLGRAPTTPG